MGVRAIDNRWRATGRAVTLVAAFTLLLSTLILDGPRAAAAGTWVQQQQLTTTTGNNGGRSVAIELNTLVAQAGATLSWGVGSYQTFDRAADGSWTLGPNLPKLGRSIDMDADLLVLGDPRDTISSGGVVYVLTRTSSDSWAVVDTLAGSDTGSGDLFGYSVAVAGDYLAVGARDEETAGLTAGAVYVFKRDGSTFSQTAKLIAPDGANGDAFGTSVAVDPSGRVVVGAPGHDEDAYPYGADMGAVYVSELDLNGFRTPLQKIPAPAEVMSTNANRPTQFGWDVATTELGLLAIGMPQTAQSNEVLVYEKDSGSWVLHSKLMPLQLADLPSFGQSLDWKGSILAVGAPGSNSAGFGSGTAYVYQFDQGGDTWNETFDSASGTWSGTEIEPSGLAAYDDAGFDVAVDRDTAVVGVPDFDGQSSNSGAAFAFVPSDWTYPSDVDVEGPPAPGIGSAPNPAGTNQTIALTATASDATTGGSIIAGIEYQLDGGSWLQMESLDAGFDSTQETGIARISFASEGTHQACARAADGAGNVGDVSCIDIEIVTGDLTPPDVELIVDPNPSQRFEDVSIRVAANDTATGGSWVVYTEYRIGDGDWVGIPSPEDGFYDSPTETGEAQVQFDQEGIYEICARATDATNHTSDPVCEQLNVGDVVPLAITFTRVRLVGSGLDDGNTADLYGRVSFLIPGREIELSNPEDAITIATGDDPASPYWNFALDVPTTTDPLSVGIGLADRDPGEVDDLADITPDSATKGVTIDIDLSTGTWPGAPLAQQCFTGEGTDAVMLCVAVSVRSLDGDQDGDGIHDAFELYGYDHNGDGTVDVDFPALGANVCRPDVAVEIDWMKTGDDSHAPLTSSIQAVQDAFANAPIEPITGCLDENGNPPAPGINLIVDRDQEIPNERGISCERIGEMRDEYLSDARKPFFLWNGWVHDIFKEGDTTSGVSCGAGGFVASLGNYTYGANYTREGDFGVVYDAATDQLRIEAGTFMHELGHKLGLGHGGADGINYKPNHLSAMNYAYQFFWLIQASDTSSSPAATLDYSRGQGRTLDEDNLTEDPLNSNADVLTLWDDPNDDGSKWLTAPADQSVDWNDNGATDSGYSQNLNRGGVLTCVAAGDDESLTTLPLLGTDDQIDTTGDVPRITVGPDGICDTIAFAGDSQRLPVGFDSRLLTSANEWNLLRYPALARTFGIDESGSGVDLEEHIDADPRDPNVAAVIEAVAEVVDAAPVVQVDVDNQTVQYSDRISPVTFTVTDSDSVPAGDAYDVPAGLSVTASGCESFDNGFDDGTDGYECTWTLAGTAEVAAGSYEITFTAEGPSVTTDIVVTPEDASVGFADNPTSIEVAAPSGDSGPFTLEVDISELQPDAPSEAAAPGDINGVSVGDVTVLLVPVGPGSSVDPISCNAGTEVDDGYAGVLPLTCSFDQVPVNTYGIEVTVSGDHYAASGEDVVTVFDPSLGFTTGGGWFTWPETTDRTNFGFSISYNKKGTNAKGSFLLIRHLEDGSIYRVKSNAIEGLSVGETTDSSWASFTTKVTYLDPSMEEPEGNHEITVYVEDRVDGDRIWMEVRDRNGEVIDELSLPRPATDEALRSEHGNIVVPHTQGKKNAI